MQMPAYIPILVRHALKVGDDEQHERHLLRRFISLLRKHPPAEISELVVRVLERDDLLHPAQFSLLHDFGAVLAGCQQQ